MTEWLVIPSDRRTTYGPIALDLRDEFTGAGALGDVRLFLDVQDGTGWIPSERKPSRNAGGIFVYTGLGHTSDPIALPTFQARVRIEATYYRPAYRMTDDGITFDVPSYNDTVPPVLSLLVPEVVLMFPIANYPFAGHIRVLRGRVLDGAGTPLANAQVEADNVERVDTDESGAFSLPLRWQGIAANVNVNVDHQHSRQSASVVFTLPDDLEGNHDITVS